VFGDILLQGAFFFGELTGYDEKAFAKRVLAPGAVERLAEYRDWLAARSDFGNQALEAGTQEWLASKGLGLGDIVHAVRVAATGTAAGPGLFDCLSVLGKEVCLRRIDAALAKARSSAS
jgi:glutamyl-tRNA synthetase